MSRIGKMPVSVPAGVDVSVKDDQISVKGTGGVLLLAQNALVKVTSDAGKLSFAPANDSRAANWRMVPLIALAARESFAGAKLSLPASLVTLTRAF